MEYTKEEAEKLFEQWCAKREEIQASGVPILGECMLGIMNIGIGGHVIIAGRGKITPRQIAYALLREADKFIAMEDEAKAEDKPHAWN